MKVSFVLNFTVPNYGGKCGRINGKYCTSSESVPLKRSTVMIGKNSIVKLRKVFLNAMQEISPENFLPLLGVRLIYADFGLDFRLTMQLE